MKELYLAANDLMMLPDNVDAMKGILCLSRRYI